MLPQPVLAYPETTNYMNQANVLNKPQKTVISGRPVSITIPRIHLHQDIILGSYDTATGSWSITPRGIHYAVLSSPINDSSGNSLIYSHNGQYTFGTLYLLQRGDEVAITTDTGYTFHYSFSNAVDYNPSDTSIFNYSGPPILTLQTCSGYFNEYRRLYTFNLSSVEKM